MLPLLPEGWRAVIARPGPNPFQSLASRLECTVEQLTPAFLLARLAENVSLVLVVDQFEELVTLCQDASIREAFAALLIRLAEDKSGRFRVVLTLRDDFLIKTQQLESLR